MDYLIPIVSITDLINGIISAVIAFMLWRMYDPKHRDGVLEFFGFYFSFAIFWFVFAAPDVFLFDAYSVSVSLLVGYSFLFIALIFLIQIPFIFLHRNGLGLIGSIVIAALAVFYVLARAQDPALDVHRVIPPYTFWEEAYSPTLRLLPGIAGTLASITFLLTFIYLYFSSTKGTSTRLVAAQLAGGGLFLWVASLVFFVFTYGGALASIVSSSFCVAALLLMFWGVRNVYFTRRKAGKN